MKIFGVILLIIALVVGSYFGYKYYKQWQDNQKSNELKIMEVLKSNQGMIIRLSTELAEVQKKVIGETLKETIVIKEEAPTYEKKKEELIELGKDPITNEEQIKVARIEFEERINEFQESPDKILINTGEEKIVIYEDKQGNLVSLQSGITITRHRKLSEFIPIPAEEEIVIKKTSLKLKAGAYYSFDNTYGVIVSKGIFTIRDYSLNVSLLIDDFEDFRLIAGADIGYEINDSLELGIGYSTNKDFYLKLQYSF